MMNNLSPVIPGRAEGANPESILRSNKLLAQGLWIPDRRFAASGMTAERSVR
jgi:hypothetical protein